MDILTTRNNSNYTLPDLLQILKYQEWQIVSGIIHAESSHPSNYLQQPTLHSLLTDNDKLEYLRSIKSKLFCNIISAQYALSFQKSLTKNDRDVLETFIKNTTPEYQGLSSILKFPTKAVKYVTAAVKRLESATPQSEMNPSDAKISPNAENYQKVSLPISPISPVHMPPTNTQASPTEMLLQTHFNSHDLNMQDSEIHIDQNDDNAEYPNPSADSDLSSVYSDDFSSQSSDGSDFAVSKRKSSKSTSPRNSKKLKKNYEGNMDMSDRKTPILTIKTEFTNLVNPKPSPRTGRPPKLQNKNTPKYKCEVPQCSGLFSRKHDLERHMKYHSGIRDFQCVCGKEFTRNDYLLKHMVASKCGPLPPEFKLDKNEDPRYKYVCQVPECGGVFTRKHDLERHMNSHTGYRDFVCICGRAFSRNDHLNKHVASKKCPGEGGYVKKSPSKVKPLNFKSNEGSPTPSSATSSSQISTFSPSQSLISALNAQSESAWSTGKENLAPAFTVPNINTSITSQETTIVSGVGNEIPIASEPSFMHNNIAHDLMIFTDESQKLTENMNIELLADPNR